MEVPPSENLKKKEKEEKRKEMEEQQEEKESVMINHIADDRSYFPLEIPEPDTSSRNR